MNIILLLGAAGPPGPQGKNFLKIPPSWNYQHFIFISGPKGECQTISSFDNLKVCCFLLSSLLKRKTNFWNFLIQFENSQQTTATSCSCNINNFMDMLRNDSVKEILRGPQGKQGLPGLTVSSCLSFAISYLKQSNRNKSLAFK